MNSESKKQVFDLIKKSFNPLILIPENFDMDAISGALGLYLFLENNKKKPHIACPIDIPEKFLFSADKKIFKREVGGECLYKISFNMGESEIKELSYALEGNILKINLVTAGGMFKYEKPRVNRLNFNYDLIFVAGSLDLEFLGKIYFDNNCFFSEVPIINIDCREKNKKFGAVNLVEPNSSVSELAAEIVAMFSLNTMSGSMANLFLTGIVVKTNNFQVAKIQAKTFALTAILLKTGANRDEVIRRLTAINLLAAEQIEFYPSSKITKQIVDNINRESSWYLRREREKIKKGESKALSVRRVFYLAATIGAIPGLMLLERANSALAPEFKIYESVFLRENSTKIEEKNSLIDLPVFLLKTQNSFPLLENVKEVVSESNKVAIS